MTNSTARARRGLPFTTDSTDDTLNAVIDFFVSTYDHLDGDTRLQKLVFYTDYRHYQEHGEQLTNANYEPYMYGLFSQEIRDALEDKDATTSRKVIQGNRLLRYHSIDNPDFSAAPVDFLKQIHSETADISTDTLAQFSKNTPMFEQTPYNEFATFSDDTVDTDYPE